VNEFGIILEHFFLFGESHHVQEHADVTSTDVRLRFKEEITQEDICDFMSFC
jgi:hypothetical protein